MSIKNRLTLTIIAGAVSFGLASSTAIAKVSPDEANKLGTSLTPIGAEKAGNADGTIPEWTGGITEAPAGYTPGTFHINPFADDQVQFTISAENAEQYKDKLTAGQMALFKAYPNSFKMNVYQTRRSASYPQYVYDETKANATRTELAPGGNGLKNAAVGFPFPMPQSGLEVIWNHIVRYRGESAGRFVGQATPLRDGSYTLVKFRDELDLLYTKKGTKPEDLEANNMLFYFKQWVTSPARLAGTALLVHETLDQVKKPRQAWTYNTGQRRVRRAPNVAYDAPGTAADGLRTTDDFDMYNGAPNRYDWNIVGKKEIYIPYNDYKLHSSDVKYDDIILPGHINPSLVRYELHRVWVVEANLKADTRHQYKKRVFYIDEDSWQIAATEMYDNQDQLWRTGMLHGVNYYELPVQWSTMEVIHDLKSGRYLALGLDNEDEPVDFSLTFNKKDFTPAALRRAGKK